MTFAVPAFPFGSLATTSALFKKYQGLLQFLSHELGIQLRKEHSGNYALVMLMNLLLCKLGLVI